MLEHSKSPAPPQQCYFLGRERGWALGCCAGWGSVFGGGKALGFFFTHVLRSSSHVSSQSQCGLALLSPASQCPQGWDGAGGTGCERVGGVAARARVAERERGKQVHCCEHETRSGAWPQTHNTLLLRPGEVQSNHAWLLGLLHASQARNLVLLEAAGAEVLPGVMFAVGLFLVC